MTGHFTGLNKGNNKKLFGESLWLKNNDKAINLIQEGIKHQLNKKIMKTELLYRCSSDGDDNRIFHSKWDDIDNTLIIVESTNRRIFGGFTTQKWSNKGDIAINDDYSFLFQINDLKNYYAIKGKGGIFVVTVMALYLYQINTIFNFVFKKMEKH